MFPVYTDICGAKFVLFYGKSGIPRTVLSKDFRNALESIDFGNRFQRDSIDLTLQGCNAFRFEKILLQNKIMIIVIIIIVRFLIRSDGQ